MPDVNEYFDGKVKSITLTTRTLPATVGVMEAGEYRFTTDCKEIMTIVSGECQVKLPQNDSWHTFIEGQVFEVEAHQSFELKLDIDVAYLCQYIR
ncbi:pyrimidine/purine nucleoside phosphorylase [Agarilytica rhodophyticola]|uniref:pyrimidine/purine nucleoside phosphorylase n=1 Tax=Agarilytica rhodophyticola TaxID=1737490 RepID=UPI000B345A53|nr:pyrimidine/purine nucleoside phosphorylase [Agarilytica rhodophyticola]